MDEPVKTIEYKNHTINIYYEENPESPREWDNLCEIHYSHKRYIIGDVGYSTGQKCIEAVKDMEKNGDLVFPLYMYEHGGITISLTPYSCPWDSGQVGFVVAPRLKFLKEYGKKIFTKKLKEKALKMAQAEVNTFDTYLRGDVYGYKIVKDDEVVDSCYGYYGDDTEEVIKEAKSVIDQITTEIAVEV